MPRLLDLLPSDLTLCCWGDPYVEVTGVIHDSRRIAPGHAFVCIVGINDDGNRYVQDALLKGASCIVSEKPPPPGAPHLSLGVTWAMTVDSRLALAEMSDRFHGTPSARLRVIGVTGTNGKGTICSMLSSILDEAGLGHAVIGTVYNKLGGEISPSNATTPESVDLQRLLAKAVAARARYAVIEVSSHAAALGRIRRCEFDVGVLSGISRDHLEFHGTLQAYVEAKKSFLKDIGPGQKDPGMKRCILNADDPTALGIAPELAVGAVTYGIESPADFRAEDVRQCSGGSWFTVRARGERHQLNIPLPGLHNVYNALAAAAVALCEGFDWNTIRRALERYEPLPGRWERVDAGQDFQVIVDFAHNPDGLEKALRTAQLICRGRKIVVFGCEGDVDPGERRPMGRMAASLGDYVIVTSDNWRHERPESVAAEIERGIAEVTGEDNYKVVCDRREAIAQAIGLARAGDLVLIAGRGHERALTAGGVSVPFSDVQVALETLAESYRRSRSAFFVPAPH